MVCAGYLAGCGGSSSNSIAINSGGAGDYASPGYNADGVVTSTPNSSAPAFAPTGAATAHSSAATAAADKLTSAATPGNNAYMVGPLDVLDVTVFKVPDLAKTVQVSDDGNINYPLVGDIHAAGKTARQIEQELKQKLGAKYLRDPQVTVLIREYNSQRVTIEGSVKTSGVFSIKGRTSLMQVLAMAGGVDDSTASGDVVLFRKIDGTRSAARFDTDAIKKGTSEDPELQPGDVIVVDTSATKLALSNIMKVLPLAGTAAMFSGL
jgi:polysaccharide export outer membrane protein